MTTSEGSILGLTKIVDHGAAASRWNLVILGDGYQKSEIGKYQKDVRDFVDYLNHTVPFDRLWNAINMYRVDVASQDSGADDPVACGGTGATPRTYFDASFCNYGSKRLLMVDSATALSVASNQVPEMHNTIVVVNSSIYGGSGGPVATFSTVPGAAEIAIHELGHSAFGLADEYEYYSGCSSGETGHDIHPNVEPIEPNVTTNTDRATMKWHSLIANQTPIPTIINTDCTRCDPQPNKFPQGTVGVFEGAHYYHCRAYRPEFDCRMRSLYRPFCAVCCQTIQSVLSPFLPSPVHILILRQEQLAYPQGSSKWTELQSRIDVLSKSIL